MADYIERETVLNALSVFNDRIHGNEHFLNGIETAKEIVEKTLSADVVPMEWIPVTERLPDFEGCCLCVRRSYVKPCVRHQEVMYFDFDEKSFRPLFDEVFVADGNVTHWMPLPKPPVLN